MIPEADEPHPALSSEPDSAAQTLRKVIVLGSAAVLFAGALGLGISTRNDTPEPSPLAEQTVVQGVQAEVAAGEIARLEAQLKDFRARLLPVDLATPAALQETAGQIPLPEALASRLIADALAGRRHLARVVLWDNQRQDGDVVSVSSGGVTASVALMNTPQTVVLPFEPGGTLAIVGVKDGGGGITVALEVATSPLALPPLRVGEVRTLPLF